MKKRIVSILLVVTMCMSMFQSVSAKGIVDKAKEATKKAAAEAEDAKNDAKKAGDKLDDAKSNEAKLEKNKKEAEAKKAELEKKIDKLLDEIEAIEKKIAKKQKEIGEKEEELFAAQVDENTQYENMKKRIKYMYESGNKQFVEVILNAEDFSELINNVEYVSSISAYDRQMLVKFQEIRKKVQKQKEELEEQYAELEGMQDELVEKQAALQETYDNTTAEIASLSSEIKENKAELERLKKAKEAAEEIARKKQEAKEAAAANEQAVRDAASNGAGDPVISGNGQFTHPCPGLTRISSYFGPRKAPKAGASTNHKGMDFAAPIGTPIYAADGGTVVTASYCGNAGNLVIINHGNGLSTYYMHTSKMFVKPGQKVTKGQNIAAVGSTGNSTGPHLHFQVMLNGVAVNPMGYL